VSSIEEFYVALGRRIHHLRRDERGLSQEQLGALLTPQLTRAAISNIETGKQRVLAATLVQIARALNSSVDALVDGLAGPEQATPDATLVTRLAPELGREKARRLVARL